jgi:hypothetical protein
MRKKVQTTSNDLAEGGENFSERGHITEEAIFNLAMEVAGYTSKPPPEHRGSNESNLA